MMSVTGTWRKKEKRSQDSTLSATGSLFFCILCLVLFKTAVTSLLLNWVLFLANSSSSQSRPCGNCHDHLQSLQSNTWEIIDWASVKLVFLFFSPFSFFLFPRVSTIETKSMGTKKKIRITKSIPCMDGLRAKLPCPSLGQPDVKIQEQLWFELGGP